MKGILSMIHPNTKQLVQRLARAHLQRMGFNKFNAPELVGQLLGVLKGEGLDDTVDEIESKKIPQLVDTAWRNRAKPKTARVTWTLEEAMARFDRWYDTDGHWIYPTKEKAFKVWQTHGIDVLPDYRKLTKRSSSTPKYAADLRQMVAFVLDEVKPFVKNPSTFFKTVLADFTDYEFDEVLKLRDKWTLSNLSVGETGGGIFEGGERPSFDRYSPPDFEEIEYTYPSTVEGDFNLTISLREWPRRFTQAYKSFVKDINGFEETLEHLVRKPDFAKRLGLLYAKAAEQLFNNDPHHFVEEYEEIIKDYAQDQSKVPGGILAGLHISWTSTKGSARLFNSKYIMSGTAIVLYLAFSVDGTAEAEAEDDDEPTNYPGYDLYASRARVAAKLDPWWAVVYTKGGRLARFKSFGSKRDMEKWADEVEEAHLPGSLTELKPASTFWKDFSNIDGPSDPELSSLPSSDKSLFISYWRAAGYLHHGKVGFVPFRKENGLRDAVVERLKKKGYKPTLFASNAFFVDADKYSINPTGMTFGKNYALQGEGIGIGDGVTINEEDPDKWADKAVAMIQKARFLRTR